MILGHSGANNNVHGCRNKKKDSGLPNDIFKLISAVSEVISTTINLCKIKLVYCFIASNKSCLNLIIYRGISVQNGGVNIPLNIECII